MLVQSALTHLPPVLDFQSERLHFVFKFSIGLLLVQRLALHLQWQGLQAGALKSSIAVADFQADIIAFFAYLLCRIAMAKSEGITHALKVCPRTYIATSCCFG